MKKLLAFLLALVMCVGMAACSGDNNSSSASEPSSASESSSEDSSSEPEVVEPQGLALVEENGVLTCLDTETSPFEGCALHIVVDKEAKTVTFTKATLEGQDTQEYYKFSPAEHMMEQFYYVSAMGTGFYYYYDTALGEMVRMEDMNHNDSTESAKENGRFDGPAERVKGEAATLEEYFSSSFGMTIAEAVGVEEPALVLVEESGVLSCFDAETSPFEGCALHIVVDKEAKTVTFTKATLDGQDTQEYYKFSPEEHMMEQFYYVSAMGTGFYYYYDTELCEMVRMEDMNHNDSTESAKENGRFDGPAERVKGEATALEEYFSSSFGMTIAEAVQ